MLRPNALGLRGNTGGGTFATSTALGTPLDSTTKVAYAAWIRIPPNATITGDILFHADTAAPGNGTMLRTTSTDALQIRTFNGTSVTQLAMPRAMNATQWWVDGRWFHVLAVADSTTGICTWYVNAKNIGVSTTTAVAWTAGGANRTTGIGCFTGTASSNVDFYDLRMWAQSDADRAITSGPDTARLAMLGYPAGESVRYLAQGINGLDASGNARHLTVSAGAVVMGAVTGPRVTPQLLNDRRRRRAIKAGAVAGVLFKPYFLLT